MTWPHQRRSIDRRNHIRDMCRVRHAATVLPSRQWSISAIALLGERQASKSVKASPLKVAEDAV
jgi:hypothetical protein